MRNLLEKIRSLPGDESGASGIIFAGTFSVVLTAMALSYDLMTMYTVKLKLQNTADAAMLHVTQSAIGDNKKQSFIDYATMQWEQIGNGSELNIAHFQYSESEALIEASAIIYADYDYLLIKDMVDNGKHVAVASSAELGIQNIEVAMAIDISSSMNGTRITEAKKSAKLFIDTLFTNTSLNDRITVSLVPFGGNVRLPEEFSTMIKNKDAALIEFTPHWIDAKWNQCFQYTAQEVRAGITPTSQYAVEEDFYSWNKNNPWCPRAGNEFIPLTDDKQDLIDKIDAFTLSDGTGSDIGMLWAYENLNHEWENKFPGGVEDTPAENKAGTKKVIIFMTDGGITSQHELRDHLRVGTLPYNSKKKVRVSGKNTATSFQTVCDRAKSQDIEIITIGYLLTNNNHKKKLENCATKLSNYIDASTGDLPRIYSNLANSISPLRLTH